METLSVLFLNWRDLENPAAGGAEVYTHEIASRLVRRGHSVALFTSRFPGAQSESVFDGVRVLRRGDRVSVYREAARFLPSSKFDVVVDEINTRPFFAYRYVRGARSVALIHQLAREFWFYETPLPIALIGRFVLEPMWLRNYRAIPTITVSESSRRDLLAMRFAEVHVVHNGVRVPDTRLPRREDVPTLAFLGRFKSAKRPEAAITAFRILQSRFPTARLWMIGDGPLLSRLERMARNLEVDCHFWGRVPDEAKWEILARAHLLFVPAVREGWGRVILEANAVGTPAVGYDVPGIRDAIVHGETGLLAFNRTPRDLAEQAFKLLSEPGQLDSMGRAAKVWAKRFEWQDSVRKFEEVLADRAT